VTALLVKVTVVTALLVKVTVVTALLVNVTVVTALLVNVTVVTALLVKVTVVTASPCAQRSTTPRGRIEARQQSKLNNHVHATAVFLSRKKSEYRMNRRFSGTAGGVWAFLRGGK